MSIFRPATPVWNPISTWVEWSMQLPVAGKSKCSFVTDHPSGSMDLKNCEMIVWWHEDEICKMKHCSCDRDLILWMMVDWILRNSSWRCEFMDLSMHRRLHPLHVCYLESHGDSHADSHASTAPVLSLPQSQCPDWLPPQCLGPFSPVVELSLSQCSI
jgi:hypothetical protein